MFHDQTDEFKPNFNAFNHLLDLLPYPGAVLLGALVAFPTATIDPSDKGDKDLLLVDLQGLVLHHAPSAATRHQSDNIPHRTGNPCGRKTPGVTTGALKSLASAGPHVQLGPAAARPTTSCSRGVFSVNTASVLTGLVSRNNGSEIKSTRWSGESCLGPA